MKLFATKGRATREEFWKTFVVFAAAPFFLLQLSVDMFDSAHIFGTILAIFVFAVLIFGQIVMICATIRRLHDRDKSGWWSVVVLAPGIGLAYLLVECGLLAGKPQGVRFDPVPK